MRIAAALALLALSATTASAGLTRAQISAVGISLPAGAHLDPGLAAPDAAGVMRSIGGILDGRPGFLTFVDYTCSTLCGTDLQLLSDAIQRARLPLADFRILVLG